MRKKERIDYLAGCLDRIIDWAHARGGDYEAMTDTTLQCMQETLDERNDLRRDKERLSAELARATTKSEYEAAWETVRLEFGVKDKPIGPERAAMEVRSIVRERIEETVSLRAKVSELQSDNEVLRDLRDTVHDVVIGASTALRREFGVAAGPLQDVAEGACEAHRRALDSLATERTTTARLTEELAHAHGQLEAALSSNATLSEDMTRMRETDEIWGRLYEGMAERLGRTFGFATEGGVLEEAVDQACAAFVEVTKGLNGLGAELAAPLGTPLAEVTVLARALRDGLRDKPKEEVDEAPKQENADEWQPLLNETVVDGSGLEGRVTSFTDQGKVCIQWCNGDTSIASLELLRSWRRHSIAKQREANERVFYCIDDSKSVREWKKSYLERTRKNAAESTPAGQQEQGAPTAAAFDALARENTRLRRKLERVFEALKDTPTENT